MKFNRTIIVPWSRMLSAVVLMACRREAAINADVADAARADAPRIAIREEDVYPLLAAITSHKDSDGNPLPSGAYGAVRRASAPPNRCWPSNSSCVWIFEVGTERPSGFEVRARCSVNAHTGVTTCTRPDGGGGFVLSVVTPAVDAATETSP
jgi:hypothetical protein